MESVDNWVSNGHMTELFKKYKDSNYKEAVEKYSQHFAVCKNNKETSVQQVKGQLQARLSIICFKSTKTYSQSYTP